MGLQSRVRGKVSHVQIGHDSVERFMAAVPGFEKEHAATVLAKVAGIKKPSQPYQSEHTDNWCFHDTEHPGNDL
ncbi:hypothetical protein D3C72_2315160 [compost metagenome]